MTAATSCTCVRRKQEKSVAPIKPMATSLTDEPTPVYPTTKHRCIELCKWNSEENLSCTDLTNGLQIKHRSIHRSIVQRAG